jgi:hypothetical protein
MKRNKKRQNIISLFLSSRAELSENFLEALVFITGSKRNAKTVLANACGHYQFEGLAVGETYILSASHKMLRFISQPVEVNEELRDLDIIALP